MRKDDSGRWYAPALTPDHVGELYELRWLLEPVALSKAAPRLPDGLLSTMRASLEDALARADEIDGSVLDRLERELHVVLLGHCANTTLMQAITLPQSLLIAHQFLYRWTSRMFESEPFLPEHLEVVDHLQAGRAMRQPAPWKTTCASRERARLPASMQSPPDRCRNCCLIWSVCETDGGRGNPGSREKVR